jgi:hypothetical protein
MSNIGDPEIGNAFNHLIEDPMVVGNKPISICFFIDGLDEFDDSGYNDTQ